MKPQVLIAERDSLHAAACRVFLAGEGIECQVVSSGLDCLALLRQSRPNVLVLDLDLPWGSGADVLAVLREDKLADLPIVVLTDLPGGLLEAGLTGSQVVVLVRPVSPLTVTTAVVAIHRNQLGLQADACLVVEEEKVGVWN